MKWDIFISHASEDKEDVARPLKELLEQKGFKVWFDETELTVGDNLRRSIEEGLKQSEFAILLLSPFYFSKKWTNHELDGLLILEEPEKVRIFPIWHKVNQDLVKNYSPALAMRIAIETKFGIQSVADKIETAIHKGKSIETRSSLSKTSAPSGIHPTSREILEAAQKSDGTIIVVDSLGNFTVQAGNISFGGSRNPRLEALLGYCLDELVQNRFIERQSSSIFELTQDGFDYSVKDETVQAKPIPLPEISAGNLDLAIEVLKCATAGNGIVSFIRFLGGTDLYMGGTTLKSDNDRRKVARWKSVVAELALKGILLQNSEDSFQVSHIGFLLADALLAKADTEGWK